MRFRGGFPFMFQPGFAPDFSADAPVFSVAKPDRIFSLTIPARLDVANSYLAFRRN